MAKAKCVNKMMNGSSLLKVIVKGNGYRYGFFNMTDYCEVIEKTERKLENKFPEGTYILDTNQTKTFKKLLKLKVHPILEMEGDMPSINIKGSVIRLTESKEPEFYWSDEPIDLKGEDVEIIKRAYHFSSDNPNRYFMQAVYVDGEGNNAVATDGMKAYVGKLVSDFKGKTFSIYKQFTKYLDPKDCILHACEKQGEDKDLSSFIFEYDDYYIMGAWCAGQFPNWKRVIPSETNFVKSTWTEIPKELKDWYFFKSTKGDYVRERYDSVYTLNNGDKLEWEFPLKDFSREHLGVAGKNLYPMNNLFKDGEEILFDEGKVRTSYDGSEHDTPISFKTANEKEMVVLMPLNFDDKEEE